MAEIRRPKRKSPWALLLMIAAIAALVAVMMFWNPEQKSGTVEKIVPEQVEAGAETTETTINEQ